MQDYYLTKKEVSELEQYIASLERPGSILLMMKFSQALLRLDWAQEEQERKSEAKIKANWEPFVI